MPSKYTVDAFPRFLHDRICKLIQSTEFNLCSFFCHCVTSYVIQACVIWRTVHTIRRVLRLLLSFYTHKCPTSLKTNYMSTTTTRPHVRCLKSRHILWAGPAYSEKYSPIWYNYYSYKCNHALWRYVRHVNWISTWEILTDWVMSLSADGGVYWQEPGGEIQQCRGYVTVNHDVLCWN